MKARFLYTAIIMLSTACMFSQFTIRGLRQQVKILQARNCTPVNGAIEAEKATQAEPDLHLKYDNDPRIQIGTTEPGGVMLKKKDGIIWLMNGWKTNCLDFEVAARVIKPNYTNVDCWPERD